MDITIGERNYQLSGLNLRAIRDLTRAGVLRRLASIGTAETGDQLDVAVAVVAASVRATEKTFSEDTILDGMGPRDLPAIMTAMSEVLKLSGFMSETESPNAQGTP